MRWTSWTTSGGRLADRVQITTDGHRAYLDAVEGAFGGNVDYAQMVKVYGQPTDEEGAPTLLFGQVPSGRARYPYPVIQTWQRSTPAT